jgi:hypothetical protein
VWLWCMDSRASGVNCGAEDGCSRPQPGVPGRPDPPPQPMAVARRNAAIPAIVTRIRAIAALQEPNSCHRQAILRRLHCPASYHNAQLNFTSPSEHRQSCKPCSHPGDPVVLRCGHIVDNHALRHTFGTHLSRAGVPPRTAQAAMRHSSIDLTMNIYTDPTLLDVAGAVEALPELSAIADGAAREAGD